MAVEKAQKYVQILKIHLNSTSKIRVLNWMRLRLGNFEKNKPGFKRFYVVTPNPEIILKSIKDDKLKECINNADLSLPDGVGLTQANKFLSLKTPKIFLIKEVVIFFQGLIVGLSTIINRKWLEKDLTIIPGKDIFKELIKIANKKGWRVVLLGDREKSAQEALDVIQRSYKSAKIEAIEGPNLDNNGLPSTKEDQVIEAKAIKEINQIKPHLLFVGFGAPRQEKWVCRHIKSLNVGGVMVVGITFEWISGKQREAPEALSKIGLEWLWRLITGSSNISRIVSAVVIFPLTVFIFKLRQK